MDRVDFGTARNLQFAHSKRRVSKNARHVEWLGDEKVGTFGAGTCVSLVTGEIIKPKPKTKRRFTKRGRKAKRT